MDKIGLWSDSINFPNLALMKISAYHKSLGDQVVWMEPCGVYDKVYLSKVFNLPQITKIPTRPKIFKADEVEKGGTGWAIEIKDGKEIFHKELHKDLPKHIEHLYPDYSLYPEFSEAYGYLTRGCNNCCPFCVVSKKEGTCSHQVADLEEFWRGQKIIKLLDPNLLACEDRMYLLMQLLDSKAKIDFTQGLDVRLLDDLTVKVLNLMRLQAIHFAFDSMRRETEIIRGLQCFDKYYKKSRWNINVYILTNYNTTHQEDWYRVCKVLEYGLHPDIRIYQKGTNDQFLSDLARWCNSRQIFKSVSFADYVPRPQREGKSCGELYRDIIGGS